MPGPLPMQPALATTHDEAAHPSPRFTLRPSELPGARTALLLIFSWKLATLVAIVLVHAFLPLSESQAPDAGAPSLASRFRVWDSEHYLYLAESGYSEADRSSAFPPLYPLIVRSLDSLIGEPVVSGLVVANLASGLGLYLFFAFVSWRFNSRLALTSLLFLLAFPTAFYLNLIYTEGLFLLLVMSFFLALYRGHLALAAAIAILLALTRNNGALIALPFAVFLAEEARRSSSFDSAGMDVLVRPLLRPRMLYTMAPLAGFLLAHVYLLLVAGDFFAAENARALYSSDWSMRHLLDPGRFLGQLVDSNLTGPGNDTLDRLCFFGFLALLPLAFRHLDRTLFAYCLTFAVLPLFGDFMSYMRYVMLAFPMYVVGARLLEGRSPAYPGLLAGAAFLVQILFISLHAQGMWVA